MNPEEKLSSIAGCKIFGMLFLIVGFPLTIIGGNLLGMFFLYPLGNVPEDQLIEIFEEEFTVIVALLGLGIIFLIIGLVFLAIGIAEDYNLRILTKPSKYGESNKKNYTIIKEEIGMNEQEIEKLMRKNILREK